MLISHGIHRTQYLTTQEQPLQKPRKTFDRNIRVFIAQPLTEHALVFVSMGFKVGGVREQGGDAASRGGSGLGKRVSCLEPETATSWKQDYLSTSPVQVWSGCTKTCRSLTNSKCIEPPPVKMA